MSSGPNQPGSEELYQRALAARRLLDEDRVAEAILALEKLSTAGEQSSRVLLGWLHDLGKGIPVDATKAERLYSAAAEAGYAIGQYYLGTLLARQDRDAEAAVWFARASEQEYAPAAYWLGRFYNEGRGVDRDERAAERLMATAARGGHLLAKRWIAVRDLRGANGLSGFARALYFFASIPALAITFVSDESKDRNLAPHFEPVAASVASPSKRPAT